MQLANLRIPAPTAALIALALLTLCASPALAQGEPAPSASPKSEEAPSRWQAEIFVGINYSMLDRPTDAAGEVTILNGSGFTGGGFTAGAQLAYPLLALNDFTGLALSLGLYYSRQTAQGFAEDPSFNQRRSLTLNTTILRLPLLAHLRLRPLENLEVGLALGPELLAGLNSRVDVFQEGFSTPAEPVANTPVTHLAISTALELTYLSGDFRVPLSLRLAFDPGVGGSSRERLQGYEDMQSYGQMEIAFNRHLLFLLGFGYTF